ncbi:amidohydrolase [Actinosynnema sp. ALI-1.44]|uniref:amidohydrolase family protein n=1 Tax=Actinosynnema sp. ALI-1.44 TaxID=1933779 RepID=UPI00097C2196|nr:amidohydrolase family protein [Actinosynnema sp. ALI-1.44]ONI84374.1 amidohydrolase [Actinosynnema sp. ALI-1.44]
MADGANLRLIDHHCHGLVQRDLAEDEFQALLTEASGPSVSAFDSRIGLAVRRWCAPVLDLPAHAPVDEYLARRASLGYAEVDARFMAAAGLSALCVDTGYVPEPISTPESLAASIDGSTYEIVRLEQVAEDLYGQVDATGFADAFQAALRQRTERAVGVKSIAAYRVGLDLDPVRPSTSDVVSAAWRWLSGGRRMADPVLQRFLIWCAVDRGLPIQFHVGLGDSDVDMKSGDPLLLMPLLRAVEPTGVPVMLLHNYPFHRHAGYLAQVFGNVYVDVGLATHNLGDRSRVLIEETLELAPFGKFLFSSDAFGLSELYYLSATLFRRGVSAVLEAGVSAGSWTAADADRLADMVGSGNATRVYGLGDGGFRQTA